MTDSAWGAMLHGQFSVRLGLSESAKASVDSLFQGNRDAMGLVPLLPELYEGAGFSVDGGLAIGGDYSGAVYLAAVSNGEVRRAPFCKDSNHAMCGPGAVSRASSLYIHTSPPGSLPGHSVPQLCCPG
jgi:hypothetical protein